MAAIFDMQIITLLTNLFFLPIGFYAEPISCNVASPRMMP